MQPAAQALSGPASRPWSCRKAVLMLGEDASQLPKSSPALQLLFYSYHGDFGCQSLVCHTRVSSAREALPSLLMWWMHPGALCFSLTRGKKRFCSARLRERGMDGPQGQLLSPACCQTP